MNRWKQIRMKITNKTVINFKNLDALIITNNTKNFT